MSDNPVVPPTVTPPASGGNNGTEKLLTQAQFEHEMALRLEREKAKYADYDQLKAAADKLKQLEDASKTEVERLKEENERLKSAQQQAEAATNALKATVEARIKQMPEDWRAAVPQFADPALVLKWLDDNAKLWAPRNAPNLDLGTQGTPVAPVKLSALELDMAKAMGLTPEVYLKRKEEAAANKRKPQDE